MSDPQKTQSPSKSEVVYSIHLKAITQLDSVINQTNIDFEKAKQDSQNLRDKLIALKAQQAILQEIEAKSQEYIESRKAEEVSVPTQTATSSSDNAEKQ